MNSDLEPIFRIQLVREGSLAPPVPIASGRASPMNDIGVPAEIHDPPECAAMAYTKYAAYRGWVEFDGSRMSLWEDLSDPERDAWRIVVKHVEAEVRRAELGVPAETYDPPECAAMAYMNLSLFDDDSATSSCRVAYDVCEAVSDPVLKQLSEAYLFARRIPWEGQSYYVLGWRSDGYVIVTSINPNDDYDGAQLKAKKIAVAALQGLPKS